MTDGTQRGHKFSWDSSHQNKTENNLSLFLFPPGKIKSPVLSWSSGDTARINIFPSVCLVGKTGEAKPNALTALPQAQQPHITYYATAALTA